MKIYQSFISFILILSPLVTFSQNTSIIPLPKVVQWDTLLYTLPDSQVISFNSGAEKSAVWMKKLLKDLNNVSYSYGGPGNWKISYDTSLTKELGNEGYFLDINAQGVKIQAASDTGLFYAIQTLRQLLPDDLEKHVRPNGNIILKHVHIKDLAQYTWRGCMIDLARNFIDLNYLKDQVDVMALYKLNRLHLHLSDDQGWRIEIKSYPNLTAVGSKGACNNGTSGYLTQEQYKELQDYAAKRMITIIPEIDMPGHIYAALASQLELNCSGYSNLNPKHATPPALYTGMAVGWSKFCLTKSDVVFTFVTKVVSELVSITKGKWIHIGGDEISDPLYGTFIQKADLLVQSLGKTSIGWEEAMSSSSGNSLIGQIWKGGSGNPKGCRTILSPCGSFYLDHGNVPGQPNTADWCVSSVSIESVYNYPVGGANTIGVEGALWTERVIGFSEFDNRLWPRLAAVAEVAWTDPALKNISDFKIRLGKYGKRFDHMGVRYYKTPSISWTSGAVSSPATNVFKGYDPDPDVDILISVDSYSSHEEVLVLYPNPVSDMLYLNKKLHNIKVFDSMGRLAITIAEAQQINTSRLCNGIYYLQASNGKAKFMVDKK